MMPKPIGTVKTAGAVPGPIGLDTRRDVDKCGRIPAAVDEVPNVRLVGVVGFIVTRKASLVPSTHTDIQSERH